MPRWPTLLPLLLVTPMGDGLAANLTPADGSGSSEMKGGNLVALEAVRALRNAGALRDMNVTVVYTGDEARSR